MVPSSSDPRLPVAPQEVEGDAGGGTFLPSGSGRDPCSPLLRDFDGASMCSSPSSVRVKNTFLHFADLMNEQDDTREIFGEDLETLGGEQVGRARSQSDCLGLNEEVKERLAPFSPRNFDLGLGAPDLGSPSGLMKDDFVMSVEVDPAVSIPSTRGGGGGPKIKQGGVTLATSSSTSSTPEAKGLSLWGPGKEALPTLSHDARSPPTLPPPPPALLPTPPLSLPTPPQQEAPELGQQMSLEQILAQYAELSKPVAPMNPLQAFLTSTSALSSRGAPAGGGGISSPRVPLAPLSNFPRQPPPPPQAAPSLGVASPTPPSVPASKGSKVGLFNGIAGSGQQFYNDNETPDFMKTTVMLRNIPNKYSQDMLLDAVKQMGFGGTFDYFYLPIDLKNRCNVGYAFINFNSPESVPLFMSRLDGYKLPGFNSQKICKVSYARVQGLKNNILHYRRSPLNIMGSDLNRPILVENGKETLCPRA